MSLLSSIGYDVKMYMHARACHHHQKYLTTLNVGPSPRSYVNTYERLVLHRFMVFSYCASSDDELEDSIGFLNL